MNERIRELYRQSHTDGFFGMAFDPEKFAELIIKECVDIADETALGETTYGWMIANRIKQHFGVE